MKKDLPTKSGIFFGVDVYSLKKKTLWRKKKKIKLPPQVSTTERGSFCLFLKKTIL